MKFFEINKKSCEVDENIFKTLNFDFLKCYETKKFCFLSILNNLTSSNCFLCNFLIFLFLFNWNFSDFERELQESFVIFFWLIRLIKIFSKFLNNCCRIFLWIWQFDSLNTIDNNFNDENSIDWDSSDYKSLDNDSLNDESAFDFVVIRLSCSFCRIWKNDFLNV